MPKEHGEFASDGHRKVGIFIMPGYSNGRMLEDLCLQTVKDTSVMLHVEKFMAGLKEDKDIIYPKEESKAKLRVFLSVMPEIANSIGIAAQKGYLEFGHEMLTDLCNFLKELAK